MSIIHETTSKWVVESLALGGGYKYALLTHLTFPYVKNSHCGQIINLIFYPKTSNCVSYE